MDKRHDQATDNAVAAVAPSVLVIDDMESFLSTVHKFLSNKGMNVDIASTSQLGLEKFYHNPQKYDAVILDIQMPEMDGYEVMKKIRACVLKPTRRVSVIAMSGDIIDICNTDFDCFIRKPFQYSKLLETILSAIES